MIEKTKKLMEELGVKGEIIEHPEINGTHSEDVSKGLNIPIDHVIKCLILKSKKGFFIAAIVLGNQRLDMKKLEVISEKKKISLASPERVREATGYSIGGIPPFAVINRFPVFVDCEVMKKEYVVGSAGTPYYGLKFDPSILKQFNVSIESISI